MDLPENKDHDEYWKTIKEYWKEIEWEDTFTITGIYRGRSSANFNAESKRTGKIYTIFMIDLFEMIKNGDLKKDKISGIFILRKRGTDYGVRLKSTPKRK